MPRAPGDADPDRPLRVLRLTPGYEPPRSALTGRGVRFNPVGGVQNHSAQLTRALDRLGVRQTVLTTRPPTAPVLGRDGAHARILRLGLPIARWRQLYAAQAAPLAPVLARRADVVHVHFTADLGIVPVAEVAARLGGCRLVVTIHCSLRHTLVIDSEHARRLQQRGGPIEARIAGRADAVIVLTTRLADALVAGGLPADKVHVVPSGVDPTAFDASTAADRPDPLAGVPRPRINYVGRLEPEKDVATVVAALPRLRATDAHLVLVGDGAQRQPLLDQARRAGVADRVHAIGFVHHDEIPAVLGASDVFVLPSRFEEMGTAMVEALHAGLPVVASAVGGIPSVVTDGVSGLLAPPGEPAAWAAALDRVLGDAALAARLRIGARRAAAGYTWPALAGYTLDVYRTITARP